MNEKRRTHGKFSNYLYNVSLFFWLFLYLSVLLAFFIFEIDRSLFLVVLLGLTAAAALYFLLLFMALKRFNAHYETLHKWIDESPDTQKDQPLFEEFESIAQIFKRYEKQMRKKEKKVRLKNRQRGEMLSAIAHEFRNPIASIVGYAQMLKDESLPKEVRERFLEKIHNNSLKIESQLSRLMLWNRFENDEAKLAIQHVDLRLLCEEIKESLLEHYQDRLIEIEVKGNPTVEADRMLLGVAVRNIVENALKYSDDEVTIKISEEQLCVFDRGIGIDSGHIQKLTKKFYRVEAHRWNNSMGLGLNIVKQILKLHRFTLHITSKKVHGSTFCILFRKNDDTN